MDGALRGSGAKRLRSTDGGTGMPSPAAGSGGGAWRSPPTRRRARARASWPCRGGRRSRWPRRRAASRGRGRRCALRQHAREGRAHQLARPLGGRCARVRARVREGGRGRRHQSGSCDRALATREEVARTEGGRRVIDALDKGAVEDGGVRVGEEGGVPLERRGGAQPAREPLVELTHGQRPSIHPDSLLLTTEQLLEVDQHLSRAGRREAVASRAASAALPSPARRAPSRRREGHGCGQ